MRSSGVTYGNISLMEGLCGKGGWRPQRSADYITVNSAWGSALFISHANFSFPFSFHPPSDLPGSFMVSPFLSYHTLFLVFPPQNKMHLQVCPSLSMMYPSNSDIHPFSIRTNLIYIFLLSTKRSVVGGEGGRELARRRNVDRPDV